ncbi:hypothetical protein ABZW11_22090 [Nonomuraea sp. NPDC004580]|uniref:hypothetical protein n=1 Tax=Nonomuraea sp. NPDC004580 TaxID=3154552 RepID=UPI0033A08CDB
MRMAGARSWVSAHVFHDGDLDLVITDLLAAVQSRLDAGGAARGSYERRRRPPNSFAFFPYRPETDKYRIGAARRRSPERGRGGEFMLGTVAGEHDTEGNA